MWFNAIHVLIWVKKLLMTVLMNKTRFQTWFFKHTAQKNIYIYFWFTCCSQLKGDLFERCSAALDFVLFDDLHSVERIATLLDGTFSIYGITSDQLVATVTDNGKLDCLLFCWCLLWTSSSVINCVALCLGLKLNIQMINDISISRCTFFLEKANWEVLLKFVGM